MSSLVFWNQTMKSTPMKSNLLSTSFLLLVTVTFAQTDYSADIARIKSEGFQNSKVMEHLVYLCDVNGQRLTGSREYLRAAQWTKARLEEYKVDNVHFEKYCDDCRGWSVKSFNVEITSPVYFKLQAYPMAMVKGTGGEVSGSAIYIASFSNMDNVKKDFTGKLKGKVVFAGRMPTVNKLTDPLVNRMTDDKLNELTRTTAPSRSQEPLPDLLASFEEDDKSDLAFLQFLETEGAIALFTTTSTYPGIVHPGGTYYYRDKDHKPLPYFAIAPEHFGKVIRMLNKQETPVIKLNLDAEFYMESQNNVNIIAEIAGSDPKLKAEVVMLGGHFDSWHGATGATDNGAGVVVLMEVMRILKAAGVKPKRTIRIGLWGGEEQAYLGSVAYAQAHFGALKTKPLPESEKVSVYLNIDNGAGAMRGIYLQGNEYARPVFEELLEPFAYLNASTITVESTYSTDHDVFDYYNIPAFQIIQDNLGYQKITHHTNLDLTEYAPEEDLKKNSVILACMAYQLAMKDGLVPRKKK
jgi:carboxypeptidase Q